VNSGLDFNWEQYFATLYVNWSFFLFRCKF